MAKKSNKTEHVLKLITRDEETIENIKEKDTLKSSDVVTKKNDEDDFKIKPDIEVSFKSKKQEEKTEPELGISKPEFETSKIELEISKPQIIINNPEVEDIRVEVEKNNLQEAEADIKEPEINFDKEDGDLVNIAELIVRDKINLVMEKMKVCKCKVCKNDVLALTLNILPTKYVTTDKGKQYFQLDGYKNKYEKEVLAALTKACVRVKAAPRHEK